MFKNNTRTLFICIGIQASGKSTFCRTVLPHIKHISLDILKTRPKEKTALEEALRMQNSCVIDNTNPTREERKKYLAPAKNENYKTVGIYFSSKLEECISRNSLRKGKAQVPLKALLSTAKKLELPSYEEGFDALYYVTIKNNAFSIEKWDDNL